jgi:hypothetical protein
MASDGAKHISFSHENCEKLICFAPAKTGTWQRQKSFAPSKIKIPAMAKISATYKGFSIKYSNSV